MPRHRLYSRLQHAQNRLLSALLEGPDALDTFQKSWLELANELEKDTRMNLVDDETLAAAHGTASIVSTLAGSFLRLTTTSQDIHQSLMKRLDATLDGSKPSIVASPHPTPTLFPIEAYEWLIQNLHNPYPSGDVKAELAAATGHTVESIAAWLHSTREKIGWTTLARFHFNNRRSALTDAAYRALCQSDPSRPLPSHIAHAFLVVKRNLERLHDNKLLGKDGNHEAPQLIHGSAEIMLGDVLREEPDRKLALTEHNNSTIRTQNDDEPVSVSAASSPPRALQLPQWNESDKDEEEDLTPPPLIAGNKRHADDDSILDQTSGRNSRAFKRHKSSPSPKLDIQLSPLAMHANKPVKPLLSLPQLDPSPIMPCASQTMNCMPQSPSQPLTPAPSSRKRRLSDASCDIIPKRPRHIRNGHRMQIVSNPLPLDSHENTQDSALFESWYHNVIHEASDPFGGVLPSDCSPATSILNTTWTDGLPVLSNDFMVPSQQVDLSDEDFKAMLASGYNMSSMFTPVDQGIFEALPSLDDLFPPSFSGLETPLIQQPAQYMIDLGLQAENPSQVAECHAQSSSIPTPLSYDYPHRILSSPLEKIDSPISDTLTQCTSLCGIAEDTLDNWTTGELGWKDTNISAQM
uniref:B1 homeodomain mating type protein n=1 Tax=Heterobasidion araucariae TaxID=13564 RepID=S5R7P5_9AGAM|nr:b1 homeodomain mating type protein [Heterobasidion araucariae]